MNKTPKSSNIGELSDEELMVLYQSGEQAAFNELYNRYSNRVYGFLRKRMRDPHSVNDLFQGVFLKLHRSKDLFNPTFMFAPWLFTIVRTTLLDWQKDHKNHVKTSEWTDTEMAQNQEEQQPRPDISSLPESQRLAVEMRYFDELSFEEIAAKLNTTSGNVRQLVSRGLKNLKSVFGEEK